jgi:hypothetical protein
MAGTVNYQILNRIAGEEGFLWQYDYGQKMLITGVDLPSSYTVHFANSSKGASIPMIGDPEGVGIPDHVLTSGKTVYFWLFLHNTANDGQTVYANMIKVHPRTALPTIDPPTPEEQSILDQLIAALNTAVGHVDDVASGMGQQIETELERAKASGEFDGAPGAVYTPSVDENGVLTWKNNGELPNPDPFNIPGSIDLSPYAKTAELNDDIRKGMSGGVASLDGTGRVPSEQLPSYVDDVVEYPSLSQFPNPGESGKIYISTSNNHQYRWTGSQYIDISYVDVTGKADKRDTVLETTLSRGRKENTTSGEASFAFGENVTASGVYSHAEGQGTRASGGVAHAEGLETVADGNLSHAEGYRTTASGVNSHAEGFSTIASNVQSHAEGNYTTASGENSHAEGVSTLATGHCSHAEGNSTASAGQNSHAEGLSTKASGQASHAEGTGGTVNRGTYTETSEAQGYASHTEGYQTRVFAAGSQEVYGGHAEGHKTRASYAASHAEGYDTYADGIESHAEGYLTRSQGNRSHAEGDQTKSTGIASHAEGSGTESKSDYSHAEGLNTTATSTGSHAEGIGGDYTENGTVYYSKAEGSASHTEGVKTLTNGDGAHAEGIRTKASAAGAHTEGCETNVTGSYGHAEGYQTTAYVYAHAEGNQTQASAYCSHSEGYATQASGSYSHAEGDSTEAGGAFAHAEGRYTHANGTFSHTEGNATKAVASSSHVGGRFNVVDSYSTWPEWVAGTTYSIGEKVKISNGNTVTGYVCRTANTDSSWVASHWSQDYDYNYVEIIGNGTGDNSLSNARSLDWAGNERLAGDVYVHCNPDGTGGTKLEVIDFSSDVIAQSYDDLTLPILVGKHCLHDGKMYECNTQINSSEAWTAAHWTEVNIGDMITFATDAHTQALFDD